MYNAISASDLTYQSGGLIYTPKQFIGEDSDGDGIPDLVELYGLKPNGEPMNTNPYSRDTDGDGIDDNVELGYIPGVLTSSATIADYVKALKPHSNPAKADTDGDGILDNEDPLKNKYGISHRMNSSYKDNLYSDVDAQIKKDFSWVKQNKNVGFYSTQECIDILYKYDELITNLSNQYLLSKAAIQTILLRELRCLDILDSLADSIVCEQFAYLYMVDVYHNSSLAQQIIMGYPEMPIIYREDSSTGYGQIFASTAIDANNWAVNNGIIGGKIYDYNNWKEREEVWTNLKDNNEYNISMVALILIWGANDKGLHNRYWKYNESEMKIMLTRYNGFGDGAVQYGNECYNCYSIFSQYNAS